MRFTPLLALPVLLLVGCAAAPIPSASPTPSIDPNAAVEVTNCATDVIFEEAPERVVTIKSTSTEMLLALGLGDRIVGTAFQDGPVADEWAADAASLVSIADKVPSEEVVLQLEPDLVYAGWESNFSAEGAGERAELASLGVASYVSPSACQSANQPAKLGFDDIFNDISEVAAIFRVDATKLIDSQKATLDTIKKVGDGRTAFWYSSGSDTPYAGGGIGAPQLLMEQVGLVNIAEDVNATWAPFSWEAVVDADPDFIVLVDATWNDVAKKVSMLESNPATANLTAVTEGRYLVLPFATTEAGVRSVEGAASLAEQIAELDG